MSTISDRVQFCEYAETPNKIIHTLACSDCGGPTWLTLTNVAHVPSATHNLVSVVRLTEAGANVVF